MALIFTDFLKALAVGGPIWFFIVDELKSWKGEKIRPFVEKYFNWFSPVFVVLLISGLLVVKWRH